MIVRIFTFLIVCLCFILFLKIYWVWYMNQARQKGDLPIKGKATMFDVRRLIIKGEIELAERLYGEIFRVGSSKAKKAVEDLNKSIVEKKSEFE